jgi:hypothetical protein
MEKEFLHLQRTIRILKVGFYRARQGVWVLSFLTIGFLFRMEFWRILLRSNKSMRYPYR